MAKDNKADKPAAVQPNPALAPKPGQPAAVPSHEVGAKAVPPATPVPGGQIPAPGELAATHAGDTGTQNPATNVFDTDDARRQTTVGQPVGTKTGERVEDDGPRGGDPDDAELRAYLSRRFPDATALAMFVGHPLGKAIAAAVTGDGSGPPARAADAPVPLNVLAVIGGRDLTIKDVADAAREIIADIRAGRFWVALDHVGELLKTARHVFDEGQHLVTSMDGPSRRAAFFAWGEFDAAVKDWVDVKAAGFEAVAQGTAPPAASGAPMPTGGPIGVTLSAGDFAQVVGVVEVVFDLVRRLRAKRGG